MSMTKRQISLVLIMLKIGDPNILLRSRSGSLNTVMFGTYLEGGTSNTLTCSVEGKYNLPFSDVNDVQRLQDYFRRCFLSQEYDTERKVRLNE